MSKLLGIVIPKVATHWDTIAYNLDFEIQTVEIIKEKCFNNPEKCCKEVFICWLTSKEGVSPRTLGSAARSTNGDNRPYSSYRTDQKGTNAKVS